MSTSAPAQAEPDSPELGYTLWAVLRRDPQNQAIVTTHALAASIRRVEEQGVTLRGLYDVSSMRADADLMIWFHGPDPQKLQWALRELRRHNSLTWLIPSWVAMGVHRDAEFTSNHLPAFMKGHEPKKWVTVYPFVRSHEWYLLPDDERRTMLGQHGRKGGQYPQVLANTVASFALGDYEWILALEADELVDLVDLMRHLRQTDARRHVRLETPFFTGRRITVDEVEELLS
ncbi:chlorite dismutase [Diaminobutyricimonas aerilata]|uniref:Coproheme decarboxylase n=1 Tax=Diaminobutyricimonas aerilata TaxID=1162967 RepID=A0A2M9CFB3_9MICO|nr:hydrogen peroxide-dependent heme synthase [Diaminobutyricimonas aerilata]PJJ70545.1 chlorite dismutase [Diaminobutyricimonas aerilata]